MLLLAALAAACASRPAAPPAKTAPPGSARDVPPVAKHAGTVFAFRFTPNADERALPIQRMDAQMREMFGVNVTSPSVLAPLGADPDRPVVVSWSIVDPGQLAAVLASPKSPTPAVPFAIRLDHATLTAAPSTPR